MRFLLDEHVPMDLIAALEERDHDVAHVARIDPRAGDPAVLERARMDNRMLVTFDSDFGRMIYYERRSAPPGVVYMRSRPDNAETTISHFLAALDSAPMELEGRFVVIDDDANLRVLPLLTRVEDD